jgi:2-keto-4-pentenoate hydratase
MSALVEDAAGRIWHAHEAGEACAPVRDLIGVDDIAAAYAVQETNTERWLAAGRRIVGRKIGLTSKAVQAQLGVDQPDFGMLYDDMLVQSGSTVPLASVMQAKVEAEIALILNRPLTETAHTPEDIAAATAHAVPAIEIVGSRIANWDIKIVDTIADNASSGMFVLGTDKVPLGAFDPVQCKMVMTRGDGTEVSSGTGAACLGSPLLAAAWLADTMVRVGRPLQADDILMTGALGPMVGAAAGDIFEAKIEGLGSVKVAFTD